MSVPWGAPQPWSGEPDGPHRRTPDRAAFTPAERRVIDTCRTPAKAQAWLRSLPYNWEVDGRTLRTFRGVVRHGTANCIEAVLAAATLLEQHGFPPIVLDLESWDGLDHVLHLYRVSGRWGTVAKSRDAGLHGRKAVFRTVRDLVYSYVDPYVDGSGRITGWGVFDLDALTRADWRLGEGSMWSVERALIRGRHRSFTSSDLRFERVLRRYLAYKALNPGRDPGRIRDFYPRRDRWL